MQQYVVGQSSIVSLLTITAFCKLQKVLQFNVIQDQPSHFWWSNAAEVRIFSVLSGQHSLMLVPCSPSYMLGAGMSCLDHCDYKLMQGSEECSRRVHNGQQLFGELPEGVIE